MCICHFAQFQIKFLVNNLARYLYESRFSLFIILTIYFKLIRCCGQYFMQTSNPDMDIFRCAWSCDERLVGAGSANMLYIYNFKNHRLEYTLPGHQGSVTCCDFSPIDPYVVLSASTDGIIYVSELQA